MVPVAHTKLAAEQQPTCDTLPRQTPPGAADQRAEHRQDVQELTAATGGAFGAYQNMKAELLLLKTDTFTVLNKT